MSYFCGLSVDEVKKLTGLEDDAFNHSLVALRFARLANGVSQLHGNVSRAMWSKYKDICPIISITNAQNWRYWADKELYRKMEEGNDYWWDDRKKYMKKRSFELVADQTGKLFDPNVFTIVWAVLLLGVGVWGVYANRRWVVNAAAVFGALHFYTQWFEYLGPNPLAVLGAGILLVVFGLLLRWINGRIYKPKAAVPAAA